MAVDSRILSRAGIALAGAALGALAGQLVVPARSAEAPTPPSRRGPCTACVARPRSSLYLASGGRLTTADLRAATAAGINISDAVVSTVVMKGLRVRRDGESYTADIQLFGPVRQIVGQPVQHTFFVSLHPPSGPPTVVALGPDGTGAVSRVEAQRVSPAGTTGARLEGDRVILPVPASLGVGPDWEVQAHAMLVSDLQALLPQAVGAVPDAPSGTITRQGFEGLHHHTSRVPVGELTGERRGPDIALPRRGEPLVESRYVPWLAADLPAGTGLVSARFEGKDERLVAVLTFNGAPRPRASLADQGAELEFVTDPTRPDDVLRVFFDARAATAKLFEVRGDDPARPTELRDLAVEVRGRDARLALGRLPRDLRRRMGLLPGASGAAAPAMQLVSSPSPTEPAPVQVHLGASEGVAAGSGGTNGAFVQSADVPVAPMLPVGGHEGTGPVGPVGGAVAGAGVATAGAAVARRRYWPRRCHTSFGFSVTVRVWTTREYRPWNKASVEAEARAWVQRHLEEELAQARRDVDARARSLTCASPCARREIRRSDPPTYDFRYYERDFPAADALQCNGSASVGVQVLCVPPHAGDPTEAEAAGSGG